MDFRDEQEKINLNNFIYDTNQKLQNLSNSIVDLTSKHDKLLAKLESKIKDLEIAFENFTQKIDKTVTDYNQRIGSIATDVCNLKSDIDEKFAYVDSVYVTQDHFFKEAFDIKERINHVTKDAIEKNAYFDSKLMLLPGVISDNYQQLKKELTPVIPDVDPLKKEIDSHLDVYRNEFRGILKEMRVLKGAKDYAEKKFENIYTLIQRLKEGKQ